MRVELMTSFLPRTRSTTELQGRDCHPDFVMAPVALMAAETGLLDWCTGQDSNLRSRKAADLQSAGISHSPTRAGVSLPACVPRRPCIPDGPDRQLWSTRLRVGAREGI